MVRLSKLADYAVVLLTPFVCGDGAVFTTAALAAATGLPLPTVAKLLKLLARGGVLRAQRGAMGGYGLARPAAEISVAAVITAIDGPIHLVDCVDGAPQPCQMQARCPIQGRWNKVNQAVYAALQSVSLDDIALENTPPLFGLKEIHVRHS